MQLNAKTTALVLIDLQKGILARTTAPHPAATVHERALQLASCARTAASPVVWVRVSFAPDLADVPPAKVDQPADYSALPAGWDTFTHTLAPTDVVVTKHQWGAFYGTDLDLQLRRRGVRTIVLGGISTSIGVESTARSAWEHGYELVICEDVCTDLSAEAHAASCKHIFPRLARIANSQSLRLA
jgi:nicotinamidase-related amidase